VGAGKATYSTSSLGVGAATISAQYNGDSNYAAATSKGLAQTISKATPTVTLTSSSNPANVNSNVTFTAAVSTVIPGVAPTGTVQFLDGSTVLGTGTLSAGKATYSTGSLPGGANTIKATYEGDANYASTSSSNLTETINKTTPTVTLRLYPTPITYGSTVNFEAVFSGTISGVRATGQVQFLMGGKLVCKGQFNPDGNAYCTVNSLDAGTSTFTATYGGDSNYNSASSKGVVLTVAKASITVEVGSDCNPWHGQDLVYQAWNSSKYTFDTWPTGTMSFYDDGVLIGTAPMVQGEATLLNVYPKHAGNRAITAVYSGDSNFNSATSSALIEVVIM
jgi:hypothetical protein